MNKKAGIFVGVIVAVFLFMAGILFVEHLKTDVTVARTDLDCSNVAGISDGTKLLCLVVGGAIPYFIILLISVIGGWIMTKI